MRKVYLVALSLAISAGSVFSQSKTDMGNVARPIKDRVAPRIDVEYVRAENNRAGGSAIWEDDFSTPANWTHDYDPTTCDLEWEVGTGLSAGGPAAIATILSTTAGNGFAMIDSDEYGGETGGTCVEDSWLQTASSIDLTGYSNVVVEFETWYRRWNYERPYLVISTDGTWPELTPDTDISGMPNVFDLWPDFPDATSLDMNPTLMRVNISAVAGNEANVSIRFHWTGTWGYAWFIDDVKVVEQPANDLVTESAFLTHNGSGDEYGRIPQSQLLSDWSVGGSFYNFGYDEQNNVVATIDVLDGASSSVMSATANYSVAASGASFDMDEVATPSGVLPVGTYEGSLVVESDEEPSSASTFGNNSYLRNFAVTEDRYSLDGIGIHPAGYENLGSLGTNSFTGAEDGFMMFAYYDVSQTVAIMGLEILLSTGTVPGGSIIVALHDTANVLADDVTIPLIETDVIDILQSHVDAGMITVMFPGGYEAEPNGYYAGVEMFSNTGANDIRILNDLTVPQPALSSMIYIPNDAVYTNGNAAAIRLITADNIGINETAKLEGVSIYPNPTNGIINISVKNAGSYSVDVVNVLGEVVLSDVITANTSFDLNEFVAGVYSVRVATDNAAFTERVIVQ